MEKFTKAFSANPAKKQTKKKRNVRRRSNGYIYLISFATTMGLLSLCVLAFRDVLFPGSMQQGSINPHAIGSIPSPELDTTILFMFSDSQGSVPEKYMLLNYRPNEGVIVAVPLAANSRIKSGSVDGDLPELYRKGGAKTVMLGIKETLGIECEFYVQFDRASFTGLTTELGTVRVTVPYNFTWGDINLSVGEHHLTGGELFAYMMYADFPLAGEDYNLSIMGMVTAGLINNNCRHLPTEDIQNLFRRILNTATTNLTYRDYTTYQRALHYTSTNGHNIASYYIPAGAVEHDKFIISSRAIATILEKFNTIDKRR